MTQRPPSKMNNAQLRVALAEAKNDTVISGRFWAGEKEKMWETIGERNADIAKRDQIIKGLTDKLTASDQQCQEYKSMAEHCGADEIEKLTLECLRLGKVERNQIKRIWELKDKCRNFDIQSLRIRNQNDQLNEHETERQELAARNKCLVDELAKWQSPKMDCNLWPIDTGIKNTRIKCADPALDLLNAKIVDLQTQIKNQSETILRMAGQMHNEQNNDSDKIDNGSNHRLGNEIVDLERQAERRKNRHKRTTDRLEIRISVLNELIADQALSIKELREN